MIGFSALAPKEAHLGGTWGDCDALFPSVP